MANYGASGDCLMADLFDIEDAITACVTDIVYPGGTNAASIIGCNFRIFRGWPAQAALNNDLSNGVINITIVPDDHPGRITTRYLPETRTIKNNPGTGIQVRGSKVTITGTPTAGDVIGLLVNGLPYAYRVTPGDTIELIATALGALIKVTVSTQVSGSTLSFNEPVTLQARVVCDAGSETETRRQEKVLKIVLWCPDSPSRDTVSRAIDEALSQVVFLSISDGSSAKIEYFDSSYSDQSLNAKLYRRDLCYKVEYSTLAKQSCPSMLFGGIDMNRNQIYG